MALRIGVNARTFAEPEPGGAIQSAKNLIQKISNNYDGETILFGHQSINNEFPENEVISNFCWNKSQILGVLWERAILPKLARRKGIDILLNPNGNAPLTSQPYRVITIIHDINALKGYSSGVHQLYRKVTVPRTVKISDKIVTVSEFSKKEIQNNINIPEDKIEVVYNGVDDFYLENSDSDEFDLPDKYVLYVGALNPRKNISGSIKSFHEFCQRHKTGHKFVIIGPGNKMVFKQMDLPEGENVITPGFLSKPELKYAYENADLFIYPSLYEGFGLPPLEAAACGTPVLVSNRPPFTELFDKESAVFVNPDSVKSISEGISGVLLNNKKRQAIANSAQKSAQKWTWERAATDMAKILGL